MVVFALGYAVFLTIIVVYFNPKGLGIWIFPVTFSAYAGIWLSINYYFNGAAIKKEKFARRKRQAPCVHGIRGAKHDLNRCYLCEENFLEEQKVLRIKQGIEAEKFFQKRSAEITQREEILRQKKREEIEILKEKIRVPEYLKSMDPIKFEILIGQLFVAQNYDVELTPPTGDGGVDGYLRKDGELILLQCKRYRGSVGRPAIQQLNGILSHYNAVAGYMVTTGNVTKQAKIWIGEKPIRVIELNEIIELINLYMNENFVIPDDFEVKNSAYLEPQICPDCGRSLRKVSGKNGNFIGCTGYPSCKYTRSISRTRRNHR